MHEFAPRRRIPSSWMKSLSEARTQYTPKHTTSYQDIVAQNVAESPFTDGLHIEP